MITNTLACMMIICTQPPAPQATRECEAKDQSAYMFTMIEDKKNKGTFVAQDEQPIRLQSGATVTWRCVQ